MPEEAVPQFRTQGLPRWGCPTFPCGLGNLVVEWAGDYVTFDKWRATPYLPSWNYSGARPTSDTKLCLPRVREQARECQAGTQQFPVPLAAASL